MIGQSSQVNNLSLRKSLCVLSVKLGTKRVPVSVCGEQDCHELHK